jgi:hypothetical protein
MTLSSGTNYIDDEIAIPPDAAPRSTGTAEGVAVPQGRDAHRICAPMSFARHWEIHLSGAEHLA